MNNFLPAIIISLIFAGVLGFATYTKYEASTPIGKLMVGKVVLHSNGATGKSSEKPFFVVELENGLRVNVQDFGEYPASYKGKVKVSKHSGVNTKLVKYRFIK